MYKNNVLKLLYTFLYKNPCIHIHDQASRLTLTFAFDFEKNK